MQFLRQPEIGFPDSPTYYLEKYKHTVRPRPCVRCGQAAYYWHPDWSFVCSPHLLDLVGIWEAKIDWQEYKEIDKRMERLLKRPPYSGAPLVMEWDMPVSYVVEENENGLVG